MSREIDIRATRGKRLVASHYVPILSALAICVLALATAVGSSAAGTEAAPAAPTAQSARFASASPAAAEAGAVFGPVKPATPALIEAARRSGALTRASADHLLALALFDHESLPPAYRSSTPWDGTLPLLHLRERTSRAKDSPEVDAIRTLASSSCDGENSSLPNSVDSTNFHTEYNTLDSSLTIDTYVASLEQTWQTEVTGFGWAAPPVFASNPPPGNRYHVRIDNLGTGLYGFVSPSGDHAGLVGNNPATAWNDVDAYASCMVLNRDYSGFPGTPLKALQATAAHEFLHSIQFGIGSITGANSADDVFVEGSATWMEDEVMDSSNDNYNYLWPSFTENMGEYNASPYPYWITFRGLTERFGTGTAGQGEEVMQDFFEATSQSVSSNQYSALAGAMAAKGVSLDTAYHDYAIAVKFNRPCGGGYTLPRCFEEAAGYTSLAGTTSVHDTLVTLGSSVTRNMETDYSLRWTALPTSGSYGVTLDNLSGSGRIRGSIACDTGSSIDVEAFPAVVGGGQRSVIPSYDPSGCSSVVAVVTNETFTAENPVSASNTSVKLGIGAAGAAGPSTTASTSPASANGQNGWFVTTPTVTLSRSGADSSFYQWDSTGDGGWTTYSTPFSALEGTHTLYYFSVGGSSTEDTKSLSLKVDTVTPLNPGTLSSTSHLTGDPSAQTTIDVTWSGASDATSGVDGFSYSFTQGATAEPDTAKEAEEGATGTTSAALGDGSWYFNLRTKDQAGNWSAAVHIGPFIVEATAPTTTLTRTPASPNGENGWYTMVPSLALDSSEVGTTYYQWDSSADGQWQVYATALSPDEGLSSLYYFSVDGSGNTEDVKSAAFKLDTATPGDPSGAASTSHQTGVPSKQKTITMVWPASGGAGGASDATSGVGGFSYSFTAGAIGQPDTEDDAQEDATGVTSGILADGIWYFNLRTKDQAGNWTGTVHAGPYSIDATAPASTLATSPAAADGWGGWFRTTPTVTLGRNEAGSTFYQWDGTGGAWTTYTVPFTARTGSHTLYYYSLDAASNAESVKSRAFKVDPTAPTAAYSFRAKPSGSYVRGKLFVPATASDTGGSGVYVVNLYDGFSLKNSDFAAAYWPSVDTTKLANGKHTFRIRAKDKAGNSGAYVARTYRVDNFKPRTWAPYGATVQQGQYARLFYKIRDPYTSTVYVTIRIKTLSGVTKRTLFTGWKTPGTLRYYPYKANLAKGTYRFHIYAKDRAGNTQYSVDRNRLVIK